MRLMYGLVDHFFDSDIRHRGVVLLVFSDPTRNTAMVVHVVSEEVDFLRCCARVLNS